MSKLLLQSDVWGAFFNFFFLPNIGRKFSLVLQLWHWEQLYGILPLLSVVSEGVFTPLAQIKVQRVCAWGHSRIVATSGWRRMGMFSAWEAEPGTL